MATRRVTDYHRFVFDVPRRELVGKFEEMYRAEDSEGFDSWRERDLRPLRKALSLTVLESYQWGSILEIGCGKGSFTHLLKKANNRVVALDTSETAIAKARQSFPDIDFRVMTVADLGELEEHFDLAAVMGTFAYVEDWRAALDDLARLADHVFVGEYIPPDPIGHVKSIESLVDEFAARFEIVTKIILDDQQCLLLGRHKA